MMARRVTATVSPRKFPKQNPSAFPPAKPRGSIVVQLEHAPSAIRRNAEQISAHAPRSPPGRCSKMFRPHVVGHSSAAPVVMALAQERRDPVGLASPHKSIRTPRPLLVERRPVEQRLDPLIDEHRFPFHGRPFARCRLPNPPIPVRCRTCPSITQTLRCSDPTRTRRSPMSRQCTGNSPLPVSVKLGIYLMLRIVPHSRMKQCSS